LIERHVIDPYRNLGKDPISLFGVEGFEDRVLQTSNDQLIDLQHSKNDEWWWYQHQMSLHGTTNLGSGFTSRYQPMRHEVGHFGIASIALSKTSDNFLLWHESTRLDQSPDQLDAINHSRPLRSAMQYHWCTAFEHKVLDGIENIGLHDGIVGLQLDTEGSQSIAFRCSVLVCHHDIGQ
jgi:hypothetical protein